MGNLFVIVKLFHGEQVIMDCKKFKVSVVNTCKNQILDKLTILEKELKYLHYDIAEDTKSSAGDKYEISREMANTEINKLQSQVYTMNQAMTLLSTISLDGKPNVGMGSLIKTEKNWIFIGVSLGQLVIENENILAISLSSPLAQQFEGKSLNDKITFNSQTYVIEQIC